MVSIEFIGELLVVTQATRTYQFDETCLYRGEISYKIEFNVEINYPSLEHLMVSTEFTEEVLLATQATRIYQFDET